MNHQRILAVDDDPGVLALIKAGLEYEGWEVLVAANEDQAVGLALTSKPDLIILDLMMPNRDGSDGIAVCRRLRAKGNLVPVIVLSGLDDTVEKTKLLNIGADDYMTKPFVIDELIARIKSVLRRSQVSNTPINHSFTTGNFSIDFDKHRIFYHDKEIKLVRREYKIFEELVRNYGKVMSYDYLLSTLCGIDCTDEIKYVHVYISRLRKKLEPDPNNPKYILNIPAVGYMFLDE
jgi:two-component system, OmpR family, KDP operon response regulator KdpE